MAPGMGGPGFGGIVNRAMRRAMRRSVRGAVRGEQARGPKRRRRRAMRRRWPHHDFGEPRRQPPGSPGGSDPH